MQEGLAAFGDTGDAARRFGECGFCEEAGKGEVAGAGRGRE